MSSKENGMKKEERYLTIEDVAKMLRKHPRTIRDWIVKGCATERGRINLDATKVGKSWLIHPEWLELFEHRIRPARRTDLDPD
jgi:hypothetical protein